MYGRKFDKMPAKHTVNTPYVQGCSQFSIIFYYFHPPQYHHNKQHPLVTHPRAINHYHTDKQKGETLTNLQQ